MYKYISNISHLMLALKWHNNPNRKDGIQPFCDEAKSKEAGEQVMDTEYQEKGSWIMILATNWALCEIGTWSTLSRPLVILTLAVE